VGRELYARLGLAFPEELQPQMRTREGPESGGGYFGELTDNESRGDFNVLLSYQVAEGVLAQMRPRGLRWIVVLAPRAAQGWGAENLQLINFLAQGCAEAGCGLVLVFRAPPAAPPHERWDLRWLGDTAAPPSGAGLGGLGVFPGVIPPELLAGAQVDARDGLPLPDGTLVLSPLVRGDTPAPVRDQLAQLPVQALGPAHAWLNGYALADEQGGDEEAGLLVGSAMDRLREGGSDVALRLLGHARRKASSAVMRAATDSVRQHFLLRLREFEEAARGPLPADNLPDRLKLGLFQSKGWGLTMTGRAAEAEPYLARARALMSAQTESRSYLYLLNISALNELRLGRFDQALALEKTIEQKLAALDPPDWHATYINRINQARLYKKVGDVAASEAYYREAIAIVDGLRSESDLLYHCLCFAQVAAKKGETGEKGDDREAVVCWLRAALHWLSNEIPEALAPRVAEAVTLGRRAGKDDELVEHVSAGLREQLRQALCQANLESAATPGVRDEAAGAPPVFARVEALPRPAIQLAVGDAGWGLFVCGDRTAPRFSGRQYSLLAQDVWRCVRVLAGAVDLPETGTVLTDAQLGSDLPRTLDELCGSCGKYGVETLVFAGRRMQRTASALAGDAEVRVSLAPGVGLCRLEGEAPAIVYKRYRPPLLLTPLQATLLRLLNGESTVQALAASCAPAHAGDQTLHVLQELRDLEARRVVRLRARAACGHGA
jgi:tetratricopeptide (TPR) repeat protein